MLQNSKAPNEPVLSDDAILYYWDNAYDFVYDNIVVPARANLPGIEITKQQKQFFDEISKSNRIAIESGHGCHPAGTKIIMRDGRLKNVEDVKVGDRLLGSSGDNRDFRTVLSLKRGTEQCYRVEYRDGTGYQVNGSHKLCLVASQSHGAQKSGDLIQVLVYDYLKWSNRKKRTHCGYKTIGVFREKKLKIPPYILGLWLGDGTSTSPAITNVDNEIISEWCGYGSNQGLTVRKRKYAYTLTSGVQKKGGKQKRNCFVNFLKAYGLWDNKHIPFQYKTSTMKDRLQLLAGIIDTDGTINHGCYSITQKNKKLALDILWVSQSLGFITRFRKIKKTCCNNGVVGTYYSICISSGLHRIPCRIPRKQIKANYHKRLRKLNYGIKVESIGEKEYYGFTLDGNNLYVLEDFTVTRNTGKSTSYSWAAMWYLCTRGNTLGNLVKIPCIAPTYHQLQDILWPEFRRWIPLSRLNSLFYVQKDEVYWNGQKDAVFARGRTAMKPDHVQGFHAPHLFWLCDEAFGITNNAIWETIEGSLTEEDNKIVMAGQHTVVVGYVHDAFHRDAANWKCLRFNSEESPLAKKDYRDRIAQKYGRDSDIYRVRVLGTEPAGNPEAFIQLSDVMAAMQREVEMGIGPLQMGVDVARFGDDSTVATIAKGNYVYPQKAKGKLDTDGSVKLVLDFLDEYRKTTNDQSQCKIKIDMTGGYGAGVYDMLLKDKTHNISVHGVHFTGQITDDEYYDGVSKMWGELRDRIKQLHLPEDDNLLEELSTRRFHLQAKDRIQIESKSDFKKQYGSSPDRADSLVICFTEKNVPKQVIPSIRTEPFILSWDRTKVPDKTCLHYAAVAMTPDMVLHFVTAVWDCMLGELFVYHAESAEDISPDHAVPALVGLMHLNEFYFERFLASEKMISDNKSVVRVFNKAFEQYCPMQRIKLREPKRYDPAGAVALANQMINQNKLVIHTTCSDLIKAMQTWRVENSKVAITGLIEALMMLVSELDTREAIRPHLVIGGYKKIY